MQESFAFGIGCIAPEVVGAEDVTEWRSEVKRVFDQIPSVRDLKIAVIDQLIDRRSRDPEYSRDSAEALPAYGYLKFNVHIPAHLQIFHGERHRVDQEREIVDFTVVTHFRIDHPVTLIISEGTGAGSRRPSQALVIVREFLKSELGKLQQKTVRLRKMGPSPFHAEFYFEPGEVGTLLTHGISLSYRKRIGYDEYRFSYDTTVYTEPEDAWADVVDLCAKEISLYYASTVERQFQSIATGTLQYKANQLAGKYRAAGFKAFVARSFRTKRELLNLKLLLLQLRLHSAQWEKSQKDHFDTFYQENPEGVFRAATEGVIEGDSKDSMETLGEILNILDEQHSRESQRLSAGSVSLVGVIIGALLTTFLYRYR